MERDFSSEMVTTFGARLRRMFDTDEHILPKPIAVALARLKRVEGQQEAPSDKHQECARQAR